ncbi:hypothetical protein [Streptomyces sp. bgisy154]
MLALDDVAGSQPDGGAPRPGAQVLVEEAVDELGFGEGAEAVADIGA